MFHAKESTDDVRKASFWGRTCGPDYWGDCETTNLEEGDWVLFENLGAYTLSMASTFHCFPVPVVYYYVREKHRLVGVGGGGGRGIARGGQLGVALFSFCMCWHHKKSSQ